jgi:hypothetical protein
MNDNPHGGWCRFNCTDCGHETSMLAVMPIPKGPRCSCCELITTGFAIKDQPYIRSLLNVPVLQRH